MQDTLINTNASISKHISERKHTLLLSVRSTTRNMAVSQQTKKKKKTPFFESIRFTQL